MSRNSVSQPPFPPEYRASGLLLHVTSLPSAYGIGDLGPAALSWIDRLDQAGQSWWQALRDQFHLPGTRVLQFAFDGSSDNPYLPHNYVTNAAVYTGTHDNPTTRGWFEELPDYQRQNLWKYLKRPGGESGDAAPALMGLAWSSVAAVAMAPFQDLLNLGREARMNVPGRTEGNWRWRCAEDRLTDPAFDPGFGHQHFLPTTLQKIRHVRQMIEQIKSGCDLEVDGASIQKLLRWRLPQELMSWWPEQRFLVKVKEWPKR